MWPAHSFSTSMPLGLHCRKWSQQSGLGRSGMSRPRYLQGVSVNRLASPVHVRWETLADIPGRMATRPRAICSQQMNINRAFMADSHNAQFGGCERKETDLLTEVLINGNIAERLSRNSPAAGTHMTFSPCDNLVPQIMHLRVVKGS